MKHYIITNREIKTNAQGKETINNDGKENASDSLRFGHFDSSEIKKKEDLKKITLYKDLGNNISYDFGADAKNLKGSAAFFNDLYKSMNTKDNVANDVLVYIHGFNNDLMAAIEQVKQLEEAYVHANSPIKHIVLFTWPSCKSLVDYRPDARDAEISGYALGRAFMKLSKFFDEFFGEHENDECDNNIHLMCQSMGNRVWENAVQMILEQGGTTKLFNQIILTGCDIDNTALEPPNPLSKIIYFCKRAHIYYDVNDKALGISQTTKNSIDRLGKTGPHNNKTIPKNVYVVDTSEVSDIKGTQEKLVRHWNFRSSGSVIKDMTAVLKGEHSERITQREYLMNKEEFRLR